MKSKSLRIIFNLLIFIVFSVAFYSIDYLNIEPLMVFVFLMILFIVIIEIFIHLINENIHIDMNEDIDLNTSIKAIEDHREIDKTNELICCSPDKLDISVYEEISQINSSIQVLKPRGKTIEELFIDDQPEQIQIKDKLMDVQYLEDWEDRHATEEDIQRSLGINNSSNWTLVLIDGPSEILGKLWKLSGDGFVIGRSPESNIGVFDDSISRSHAKIIIIRNEAHIMDLESSSKTFVNGQSVPPFTIVRLSDNDKIKLGNITFEIFSEKK